MGCGEFLELFDEAAFLEQKLHIRAANGFENGNGALAVGEALNVGLAEGLVEMVADAFRQSGIGVSGEYLDFFAV